MHNVFRDDHVYVCREMCSTCVFRPGNLMDIRSGRLRGMIDEAMKDQSAIVCHKTLGGDNAICRGFFDRHRPFPLQLAIAMKMIKEVSPE